MKILLSNDDGVLAPGINILAQTLSEIAEVMMIAPDRNCSGASTALTLINPVRMQHLSEYQIACSGTPADCVHIGVRELYQPDIVISGINAGANLGDDTLYSGTVGAAIEGRFLGLPAIAVSLVGKQHYQTAAVYTLKIVNALNSIPLDNNQILNINVPDLPLTQIKGIKVTRLGVRKPAADIICQQDPAGREIYWLGALGQPDDCNTDTDFAAIAAGYVSITPLTVDLTAYKKITPLQEWVAHL